MTALLNIRGILALLWLMATGALAWFAGEELDWGNRLRLPLPTPVITPSPKYALELLPDYSMPPLDKAFTDTNERPLFVPTRRKAPPIPPPEIPKPTMRKGQFRLVGTVIAEGLNAALLLEFAGGKLRQLEQGKLLNGIRLESIEPDRVVMTQYDDREELPLKIQPSASKQPALPAQKGAAASPQPVSSFIPPPTPPRATESRYSRMKRHIESRTANPPPR